MLKTWQKLVILQLIYSVSENPDLVVIYRVYNRMRNIYDLIKTEFGKENVTILRKENSQFQ